MEYVQRFDLTDDYESERHVLDALRLADGWAYAVSESRNGDMLTITSLQSDTVHNVSRDLFRTREALASWIWKLL